MDHDKPLGIVGLGPFGDAIARRLANLGFAIRAWDARTERRNALGGLRPRIELAATPTDIGMECDVVIATLDAAGLRAAALGDADRPGFALSLEPGSLVVDMGLSAPQDARVLAHVLSRGGIGLLDAPALGTAEDARAGRLEILLAGYVEFADRLAPLLGHLGEVTRCGPGGNGHAAAILKVYARFAAQRAAEEALRVGENCGLAPQLLADVASAASAKIPADDPRLHLALRFLAANGGDPALLSALGGAENPTPPNPFAPLN